jgi:hypothetical protein
MDLKRCGSQPSGKGSAEYFTGTVRIDPLFQANDPARALGAKPQPAVTIKAWPQRVGVPCGPSAGLERDTSLVPLFVNTMTYSARRLFLDEHPRQADGIRHRNSEREYLAS